MIKLFTTVFAVVVSLVTVTAQAQDIKGDAKAGQAINAMCIGCHGIKGYQASFPEVYKVPMISGQSAKYIVSALNAYKKGERKHPSMRGIAETLTDQNMADLAAYYSGHGVVLANLAGRVLCDLYADHHEPWRDLPFYQSFLGGIPPEPLRWIGYHAFTALTGRSPRRYEAHDKLAKRPK
jgi:cytochrome c553